MFSFLYEGKLGEMLAPVIPINQLLIAIQNHKNIDVQNLITSQQFDLRNMTDVGHGAIHVACRYNNLYALELIILQGNFFILKFYK